VPGLTPRRPYYDRDLAAEQPHRYQARLTVVAANVFLSEPQAFEQLPRLGEVEPTSFESRPALRRVKRYPQYQLLYPQ